MQNNTKASAAPHKLTWLLSSHWFFASLSITTDLPQIRESNVICLGRKHQIEMINRVMSWQITYSQSKTGETLCFWKGWPLTDEFGSAQGFSHAVQLQKQFKPCFFPKRLWCSLVVVAYYTNRNLGNYNDYSWVRQSKWTELTNFWCVLYNRIAFGC